jgi:hypothetical protein
MGLPPLPAGATLLSGSGAPSAGGEDPLEVLRREGFVWTNGFRTPADIQRLREQGYKPASHSTHMQGDTVDLTHPGMSAAAQARRLRELFGSWKGFKVLDEGDHRHMRLPGWNEAPGTPGTRNSGLPALPDGASLYQRGSLDVTRKLMAGAPADGVAPDLSSQPEAGPDDYQAAAHALVNSGHQQPDLSLSPSGPLQPLQAGQVPEQGQPSPVRAPSLRPDVFDPNALRPSDAAAGRAAVVPAGHAPTADGSGYVATVDPAKNAQLQAAFERGASVADLAKLANRLGIQIEHGNLNPLRAAVRYRDGGGIGARIVPDTVRPLAALPAGEAAAREEREDRTRRSIQTRLGDQHLTDAHGEDHPLGRDMREKVGIIAKGLGHPYPHRLEQEASYVPGLGGVVSIDEGTHDVANGHPVRGAVGIVVGSLDFVPGGAGGKRLAAEAGTHIIDSAALRAAADAGDGAVDAAKAGEYLRGIADDALANGGSVTLHVGGQSRPITRPGLVDEEGQAWGAMPILSPAEGDAPRLEVHLPEPVVADAAGAPPAETRGLLERLSGVASRFRRGGAEAAGDASTEARAAVPPNQVDEAVEPAPGHFGPVHPELAHDFPAAVARLKQDREGMVPGALHHPDIGAIDLVWGNPRYGLDHILRQHPDVVDDLPSIIESLPVRQWPRNPGANRFVLEDERYRAVVSPDFDGDPQHWLVTAFRRKDAPGGQTSRRDPLAPDGGSTGAEQASDIGANGVGRNVGAADDLPPLPPGAQLIDDAHVGKRPRPGPVPTADDIAARARAARPESYEPINNVIEGVEEVRGMPSSLAPVEAPNEYAELASRRIPSRTDLLRSSARRGPLDLSQRIRQLGGVKDQGGNLAHMGVTNDPRRLDFGNDRGLGRLIDNEKGMPLDEATHRLWEEGWFPDQAERPSIETLLDALHKEQVQGSRVFHPEDAAEVERFHAAQAERERIEGAAEQGAPLVEERGRPAGLDDLRANDPPATAYEDLPTMGGKVANINLARVESRADIRRALQNTEAQFGGFSEARRGTISHAETEALASELNMTAQDLLRRRRGQALNAEQALQARRLLAQSADELTRLAQKVKGGSDEEIAAFHRALTLHAAIQEQVTGATAEAGRALAQFRIMAKAKDARARVLQAVIEGAGGRNRIEDVAEAILDLKEVPGRVNRFARDAVKPTFKDKLVELWYNSLLSGPKTHAVNILSNTLTSLGQLPEHAVAAGIGSVRHAVTRAKNDRVLFSEVGARAVGWVHGLKEGLTQARRTFLTEQGSDFISKVEGQSRRAIEGTKGRLLRVPTRLLSAEDELFKAMARKMELSGLAVRIAGDEARAAKTAGKPMGREAVRQRAADLLANPTDEMVEKAFDYGRYVTFQRPLSGIPQTVLEATNRHPILKLVLPFVRTPTNLFKYSLERSPLAPLVKDWRADIRAGGARRDLAVAKAMIGTGMGASVMMWAAEGRITGSGPADPSARRLLEADGWQPYSVRLGDHYVSYQRLDPFGLILGTAADLATKSDHMTAKQREHQATIIAASIMGQMKDKTWLQGVSNVMEALDDPRGISGKAGSWLANTAGSIAVPAVVAQSAQAIDPVARQAKGPWERIKARIPGLSSSLKPRIDVWGQPVPGTGGSPLRTTERRNDLVTAELLAIGARMGMPNKRVGRTDLTPEQYSSYAERSGKLTYQWLKQAIEDPSWANVDAESKLKVVDAIKSDARETARAEMFPELVGAPQ